MNKQIIFIPGLFALGILTGIFMMLSQQDDEPIAPAMAATPTQPSEPAMTSVATTAPDALQTNDIESLQNRVDQLISRVEQLEQSLQEMDVSEPSATLDNDEATSNSAEMPASDNANAFTENLLSAGVDSVTVEEIVRRRSELDLKRLELRDTAIRGGYIDTERYRDELNELLAQDISIREEFGDDVYDRFLYNNGQSNRIRIDSVMMNSAAEQAGFKPGDMIMDYDEQRLFDYTDLQQATTQGTRDEYVSVTVERDGEQMMLWIPRGPMGVRLTNTRIDPDL
ncbi:MAG: PDZ domain-containing protein [Candidatus Thiodiazotropha taylori]|nr:PDZ domain-containing protein [Candidatus Thiodiazotropha taylori]MCG8071316.1 PDZ domain-containing protein [Candidatus Thiodiazotropha taylori]MCG8086101.1 PDZ domain-containing protein [Candidatus Thiodiazotropha taylori]MCG8091045.1 PDZ domain-containing protein [Candidatus Thiodiazotropha taylori]MCW4246179.1 PDZ domain-containing protein [Candidatus Thiodiazotropha taylori]